MVEKEIKKVEPQSDRYELTQVPESMRTVVADKKTDVVLSEIEALVLLLNKVDKIERSIA